MKIEFSFLSPNRMHPKGERLTTSEIATVLESKYELISGFTDYVHEDLMDRMNRLVERYIAKGKISKMMLARNFNRDLGGWLQNQWRDYINTEAHGIETQAAKDQNRQSFVETGDYFKSLQVRIKII